MQLRKTGNMTDTHTHTHTHTHTTSTLQHSTIHSYQCPGRCVKNKTYFYYCTQHSICLTRKPARCNISKINFIFTTNLQLLIYSTAKQGSTRLLFSCKYNPKPLPFAFCSHPITIRFSSNQYLTG